MDNNTWIRIRHKHLGAPDRTYQRTQRKKTPFRSGAPVSRRPKTLGCENQLLDWRMVERNWQKGNGSLVIPEALFPLKKKDNMYLMDACMETELVDCCNLTICTCWILRNDRDHSTIGRDHMQDYLLQCITTHAYVRALHIFNMGMIELRNKKRRFWQTAVRSFWFGVRDFELWKASEW